MKRIFINLSLVLSLLLIQTSCTNNDTKETNSNPVEKTFSNSSNNLNISILLDLSDWIDTNKYPNKKMEFYKRNIGYVNSVVNSFYTHLIGKKTRQINDRIQIFTDPAPNNENINSMISQLKTKFDKNVTSDELNNLIPKYKKNITEIYKLAMSEPKFPGSDTWGFMKNKVNDYCIKENYRNILIIITDGYMYQSEDKFMEENKSSYILPNKIKEFGLNTSNWKEKFIEKKYGFIKANDNLENLDILVLGIDTKPDGKNPFEFDVLKEYWANWFRDMKVNKYEIKQADLPTELDEFIQNFILKN